MGQTITIVDYNAGNLRSVQRACEHVGAAQRLSNRPEEIEAAERIIFPGVGAAPSAMATLKSSGLGEALRAAFEKGTPIFGICLGTQIVMQRSEEGDVPCLGLVPGMTVKLKPTDPRLKIPHIGWNEVRIARPHPMLAGIEDGSEFYFVHSFHPRPSDPAMVRGVTDYEQEFCSALAHRNLFATQFHPEKSGRFGLRLFENFKTWDGNEGEAADEC